MMPAVIAAEGTAFALLAGLDGSVTWQAARVLMGDRLGRLVHPPGRARWPGRDGFRARDRRHRGRRGCGQRAAGGVILLVWRAAALVRAIPGWWRLLAIPPALVLLWFVLLPRPMSIPDAIRAAGGRPTLIIAAGSVADEPVAARWFRAASPATVQVWVVPHAGHTQSLAIAPQAWEAHVIGFLDAALKP